MKTKQLPKGWKENLKIEIGLLKKIKEIAEKNLKNQDFNDLGRDNFKCLILDSVVDWEKKVRNGLLNESENFPSVTYQKKGEIYFHKEILEKMKDISENKIDYMELLTAHIMHERIHCYLGHIGGEGKVAEDDVNGLMDLFAPSLQRLWSKYNEKIDKICKYYKIK